MASISEMYNKLRLEQQLCDAVIITADGGEFHVHKIIMCGCSSYFVALFTRWSTPDRRVYNIPNVSAEMMRLIIEFAYTGAVPVTEDNIQELFTAADQFHVKGITEVCCSFMEEHMVLENCIQLWQFTSRLDSPDFCSKALLYIQNNFEELAATSSEFLLLSVQELIKIIESDQLNARREELVLEAILRWIDHSTTERRNYIPLLLSKVRLALVDPQYLTGTLSENVLVKSNQECRQILLRVLEALLGRADESTVPGMFRPRLPPAVLVTFGGWNTGGPKSLFEAYNVRADRWSSILADDIAPRGYHGMAYLDGSIYCVGGFHRHERFNSVDRFDLATHTWHKMSHMHVKRSYVSLAVMDGYIYALGGYDGHDRERLRSAERYDPKTNQWTVIASMHERRSDASCTALNGKLYICGGFTGAEALSSAECYNPETDQWTLLPPMSTRRAGVGVVTYDGQIFAVGGFDAVNRLHTVEAFNPQTNTWRPMPSLIRPRSNFGIEVMDGRIFVIGGYSFGSTIPYGECFDVRTGEWSEIKHLGELRSALGCCVVHGIPNLAEYAGPQPADLV